MDRLEIYQTITLNNTKVVIDDCRDYGYGFMSRPEKSSRMIATPPPRQAGAAPAADGRFYQPFLLWHCDTHLYVMS
jgi:hypothetical protein